MAGPIRIAITANGRQARAEISGVAAETDLLGKSFSRAGKLLAAGFAVDKVVRGVGALVETGGAYVETLNKVKAISKSSQAQINAAGSQLEAQAAQYGKMGETAGDAADGLLELTKSGLSLKKSLAAVYPTMVLAKSGGLEVADASQLVANTLNTFSLKASKAADIANDLANAADISSADVSDLAESFKYVAPLAAKSGVSLSQTNALLAELANSGVKASNAGTGLRKFLASLQAPTGQAGKAIAGLGVNIYDATGKMKPIGTVIDDLRGSLGKLTQQDQNAALRNIFGLTGITSAQIILKQGVSGLSKYTKGVTQAGGAARLANASSKGLLGELKALRAEFITNADALYRKYSPAVDSVIRADLPKALATAKKAGAELLPTVKSLASTAVDLGHDVSTVAQGPIGKDFVGALKLTVGLVKPASDALDSIPAPIRQIGIEAGVGALLLGKLSTTLAGVRTAYGAASSVKFESGLQRASQAIGGQVRGLQQLQTQLVATARTQQVTQAVTRAAAGSGTSLTGLQIPSNAAAAQTYTSGLKLVETQSVRTKLALSKLSSVAGQAAGIGGFVALTAGAKQSNAALGTLEDTAGGAAVGFSVGGPFGAAIGGLGGLVLGLTTKLGKAGQQAREAYAEMAKADPVKQASAALQDLKTTLDQVTGAYTGATRAAVLQKLQQSGLAAEAAKYGISSRALVDAALGQKGAMSALAPVVSDYQSKIATLNGQIDSAQGSLDRFTDAAKANGRVVAGDVVSSAQGHIAALEKQRNALQASLSEFQQTSGALKQQAQQTRDNSVATATYGKTLKGLPKAVKTAVKANGVEITAQQIAELARRYKLTPKQIKTVVTASKTDATIAQIQKVIDKTKAAGKTKVDFSSILRSLNLSLSGSASAAAKGGAKINQNLKQSTGKAKANLDPFRSSVIQGAQGAVGPASSGGHQVGSALQAGVISGFAGTQSRLVAAAVAAVGAAIAAARARAKVHSPSKETEYIGRMMGVGLAQGLEKTNTQVSAAAAQLTAGLLGALTDQSPIAANLQTISDYVSGQFSSTLDASTKSIDRKYAQVQRVLDSRYKATEARIKKTLDGKAQTKALDKAEKAHESLSNQIDRAKTKSENAATAASKAAQAAALKATEAQRDQLAAVIQQQKDVKDQYDGAVQSLTDLKQAAVDYASSVRDAVTASGSLSNLAQAGATSLSRLLSQRAKAVQQAKDFAAAIATLTSEGLNTADIQDLESQGPAAALKTAQAIATGGQAAVDQLNSLQAQLQTTGQQLGDSTAQVLYGAGITAAQGLVDGLAAQQGALTAIATTLGQQIAQGLAAGLAAATTAATKQADTTAKHVTKAVKTRFAIKSPSKVFEGIGVNVVRGLGQGLAQSTYATRPAAALVSKVTAVGTPALDAYMSQATGSVGSAAAAPSGAQFASMFGDIYQQPGESSSALAERLWFLTRTRG